MYVTITTLNDRMFTLEISDEMELENLKALCEFETGIPANKFALLANGIPLHDAKRTMKDYGIKEGDVLLLQDLQQLSPGSGYNAGGFFQSNQSQRGALPQLDFSSIKVPGPSGSSSSSRPATAPIVPSSVTRPAEIVRQSYLNNPHQLSILKERNPALGNIINDTKAFAQEYNKQLNEKHERESRLFRAARENPFDPELQRHIEEELRQKNIDANMESAIEHTPETFGQVVMLYIDCKVNGHPVKAFVDSGAQATIMSRACAERCNIMRLVDTRWAGIARGVGTQKILGRVHLGQIQIENVHLHTAFTILAEQTMDLLLGLDMLRRHQCTIDLKVNVLIIGTTGTKTPFLSESELPASARIGASMEDGSSNDPTSMEDDPELAEALAHSIEDANAATTSSKKSSSSNQKRPIGDGLHRNNHTSSTLREPNFKEEIISQLTSQGFSRTDVISALTQFNGDIDHALAYLTSRANDNS